MNKELGNYMMSILQDLPFADVVGGLVQTLENNDTSGEKTIKKKMPVSLYHNQDNEDECRTSISQREFVPDSSKKSIMYIEDGGAVPVSMEGGGMRFKSNLVVVAWLNKKKLVDNYSSLISAPCIYLVLDAFMGKNPVNYQGLTRIEFKQGRILPQDNRLFSKYTYDEKETQYLMPPFEYFGIELTAEYVVTRQTCLNGVNFGDYGNC